MIVLNYRHSLTNYAKEKLKDNFGRYTLIERKITIYFQRDVERQISDYIDELGDSIYWEPISILIPSLSIAAVLLVIELYARVGTFPKLIQIKRDSKTGQFLPSHILDLQELKTRARGRRTDGNAKGDI